MARASGEQGWWGLMALALLLALVGGVARAAPDAANWAFDLLGRVEPWQSARPLDFLAGMTKAQPVPTIAPARIQAGYGRLPMHFEPNLGQTADEVKFVARGPGYTLFLTADEAVLALRPSQPTPDRADPRHRRRPDDLAAMTQDNTPAIPGAVIRTRLEGATRNPAPQPEGLEKLPGISNYFLGNDPANWRTHVPHYQRVRYPNVYPGIDLVYYGNPQHLEHDFIVAPGADPAAIQLAISGADHATVNAEGDLVLQVPGGEVVQQAPRIYQVIDGQQQVVAGRYVLRDAAPGARPTVSVAAADPLPQPLWVGFEVAQYDRKQPLVIDPVLVYSTYLGGSDDDKGGAIAVDSAGNVYVTGWTNSYDFPTRNALDTKMNYDDAFIVKLNAGGTELVYATYLGGRWGDEGLSIAVDSAGNAYVTGETWSEDFPIRNALYPSYRGGFDAFITKLNTDGTALIYSTYLGGSGKEYGFGIAVDRAGNAYVTGLTESTNFPTRNPLDPSYGSDFYSGDCFLAKFNNSGTVLIYSTYLGGSSGDVCFSITVDSSGNAYVTGKTNSTDFPIFNALYPNKWGNVDYGFDAFVTKLNTAGTALVYSTYLGGNGQNQGNSIAVDGDGNAYVTGETNSTNFPTHNALYPNLSYWAFPDAFITKINPNGTALVYSTYLGGYIYGGYSGDRGYGIAVDGVGNVYVTGSATGNFPTGNALYPNYSGQGDAFITKLNASGTTLVYSTYLGGSSGDQGFGIAVDGAGNAYVTGRTESANFPTRNALYPNYGGGGDAFIVKIADDGGGPSATLTVSITGSGTVYSLPEGINCGSDCSESFVSGTTVTLTATAGSGYVFGGWLGACTGINLPTCTLTMNTPQQNTTAVFKNQNAQQEPPPLRYMTSQGCAAPQTGRGAVVITHGWQADAADWVSEMAQGICNVGPDAIIPAYPNTINLRCTTPQWDVWIGDWRFLAFTPGPWDAWMSADNVGRAWAKTLRSCAYQHIHFIAHSAGSNAIHTATRALKKDSTAPAIHQTFLDAYDPSAKTLSSGRQQSDYGENADWADNYVDLRSLAGEWIDKTELYLSAGYNINVTPSGNCVGADGINATCKHGRPYRFYGDSITPGLLDDLNNHHDVDPIGDTAGMGYPLSLEQGKTLAYLNQNYPKGKECHVIGSNCDDTPPQTPGIKVYTAGNASGAVRDQAGIAQCVNGGPVIPCSQIGLTTGAAVNKTLAESATAQATDAPTQEPAWLAMQIQTTQPTNTLRFSYRFAAGGEGLLRVFVNENTVREIDQRYVPIASTEVENVYIGELPAGVYRIAFRLDGYGANPSGVELTGVELGHQTLVEDSGYTLMVTKAGTGTGTVTGTGINCGSDCTESYASGTSVALTATPASGSTFAGWSGACSGTGNCTVTLNAAKSVMAIFSTPSQPTVFKTAAGTISWFYAAAFSRTPVPNSALPNYGDIGGLAFWTNAYLAGEGVLAQYRGDVYAIADFFVGSAEFQTQYPASLTHAQFVTALYDNMLGRAPDAGGLAFWVGLLDRGESRGRVLADFTNSDENRDANPIRKAALESFIAFIDADANQEITPQEAAMWLAANPNLDGAIVD